MYYLPAVVDFPTPPLPDATSTTCLTPAIGHLRGSPLLANSSCPVAVDKNVFVSLNILRHLRMAKEMNLSIRNS